MREHGMKWTEIADEMGLSEARICSYRVTLQRLEKEAKVAAKPIFYSVRG